MKIFYKQLADVPPPLVQAYDDQLYSFDPRDLPTQAHTHWQKVDWINFVRFRPELEALRQTPETQPSKE